MIYAFLNYHSKIISMLVDVPNNTYRAISYIYIYRLILE